MLRLDRPLPDPGGGGVAVLGVDLSRARDYPDMRLARALGLVLGWEARAACCLRIGIIPPRPTILRQRSKALRGRRSDGHGLVDAGRRPLGLVRGRVLAGGACAGSPARGGEASSGADGPAQPLAGGRGPGGERLDAGGGRAVPGLAEGSRPAARTDAGIFGATV